MCFKLGRYQRENILGLILPSMTEKAFIHKYVWEHEILQPAIIRERLQELMDLKVVLILNESDLTGIDRFVYEETVRLLSEVMIGHSNPRKNLGEVLTLAMAYTKGIPILLSDERKLQVIVDAKLNKGSDSDIRIIRLQQVVQWVKDHPECGVDRKTAKKIWCGSCDERFAVI